jgi:hypothetical protein
MENIMAAWLSSDNNTPVLHITGNVSSKLRRKKANPRH